ncbi:hypothetical protein [Endozoicomonas acroporae]|uniref:hypothetical protein n=1 Tax=Endozoicomonas acroporae TaxID=1701104 RepID=UPI003D79DBE0
MNMLVVKLSVVWQVKTICQEADRELLAAIINDFDQGDGDWDSGAAYDSLLFTIGENGLARITASIMVNDIAQLKGIILDRNHGLELRVLALETMKSFYFEGDISRSEPAQAFIH